MLSEQQRQLRAQQSCRGNPQAQPKPSKSDFGIFSANVTIWSDEKSLGYLATTPRSVVCIQEHRLGGAKLHALRGAMGRIGWSMVAMPANSTDSSTSGGVLLAAKQHLDFKDIRELFKEAPLPLAGSRWSWLDSG